MLAYLVTVLIGLLGGVSVGFQSPIVGAMGQRIGSTAGSLIVHVSGAVLSLLLLALRRGENIGAWQSLPWYMLVSGAFGVFLFQTINVTLPRLGATMMVVLIVTGQLAIGVLIDHFGWFDVAVRPVDGARLLGLFFLFLGAYLVAR